MTSDSREVPVSGAVIDVGITAGVAALFLLLRLLAVTDWNWHTASAVADTINFGDAISISFGTVLAQPGWTGVFIVVLLPLTVVRIVWPVGARGAIPLSTVALLAALIVVTVALVGTFGSWWVVIGATAFGAAFVVLRLCVRHGITQRAAHYVLHSIGLLSVIGVLVLAAVVSDPWIPHERIETSSTVLHGYVLKADPGFVKILTDSGEFLIVRTGDILARSVDD